MDINTYLQCFESRLSSYTGDDPLDLWDKFVQYLEQELPAGGSNGISVVLDRLVQRFLDQQRYANDPRYVNYCIRCASSHSDPVTLYGHLFSRGVGSRSAALFVSWAQHCEQRGLNQEAEALYQRAVENQAQPQEALLHQYRQFQSRNQAPSSEIVTSLQTTHLSRQRGAQSDTQCQASEDFLTEPSSVHTLVTVSRSENVGVARSTQGGVTVSEYLKDELLCDGGELSFEEVRAQKYFCGVREREKKLHKDLEMMLMMKKEKKNIHNIKSKLEEMDQSIRSCGVGGRPSSTARTSVVGAAASSSSCFTQGPLSHPAPSTRLSSRSSPGLTLLPGPPAVRGGAAAPGPGLLTAVEESQHPLCLLADNSLCLEPAAPSAEQPVESVQENLRLLRRTSGSEQEEEEQRSSPHQPSAPPEEVEEKQNMSQGGSINLSHVTPNSSLLYIQATPSRVLPSPTVNTREALDAIMDMFQAPTLLEEPFNGTTAFLTAEKERDGLPPGLLNPPRSFTVFQDEDKENSRTSAPAALDKPRPVRTLAEVPASRRDKPNETPPDLIPDDSTMWGAAPYSSLHWLAACPNSTSDFAPLAQFVSTPFTNKNPGTSSDFYQDQDSSSDSVEVHRCGGAETFIRRQSKKLSPILEQSPSEEKLCDSTLGHLLPSLRHGTIIGEGHHRLTSSSITMVQPVPPAVLSFRDQTPSSSSSSSSSSSGRGWEVYTSPDAVMSQSRGSRTEVFKILEDQEEPQESSPDLGVPMSPDRRNIQLPEPTAFLSPRRPWVHNHNGTRDAPMSPEPGFFSDVPMSPEQPMMSPRLSVADHDESVSPEPEPGAGNPESSAVQQQLVSDPWDQDLLRQLLASLTPPLTAHPRCVTWPCQLPAVAPKTTLCLGDSRDPAPPGPLWVHVDCVLGEGAFATVYQATDPVTSERMVLKVQKPANPWEFYIHTQLDARLPPQLRPLFSRVTSAHLFHNGSVLVGELHGYGTLLHTVNLFKSQPDRLLPQPLVLYFTACILHMVELLHSVQVVHADIKPDNFLLGERFLDNCGFEAENLNHGLVLVDLGQSIDMRLFPEGTAFTARCQTSGFQCTEMLSGKPWNYQSDYFGLAGTVHCLLFGTYMQVTNRDGVWTTNAVFRRNPHSALWLRFFHTLLNVPDCGSLPDLRNLRAQLTDVLRQNYSGKLSMLKSRLQVLLLENRRSTRR